MSRTISPLAQVRASRVTRTVLGAAVAAVLLASSAACTSGDASDEPAPSASSTPSPADASSGAQFSTPPADLPTSEVPCTDGRAVVETSNEDVTVPGDCASVEVVASNSIVHLGDVDQLTVSGTINDLDAGTVGTVTVTGNGNRLTTDNDPDTTDEGQENVFVQR